MAKAKQDRKKCMHLELNMAPHWDHVSNIRNFVGNFIHINFSNKRNSDHIIFSISELLENVIKYSDKGEIHFLLIYTPEGGIEIITENTAKEKNIVNLKREINALKKLTPEQAYEEKVCPKFKKNNKTGLGLAMIREKTKGEFHLTCKNTRVRMKCKISL